MCKREIIEFDDALADSMDIDSGFRYVLDYHGTEWIESFKKYINSCVSKLALNQIKVEASQRARAIDIYENLNRGGVSLNTFDLIMARVAKVKNGNTKNFKKRMIEAIKETKQYSESVLPEAIKNSIAPLIRNNEYNATLRTACYVEGDKNELNAKYIDVFLDVLGLYCGTRDLDPEKIRLEDMKKNHILSLSPEDINDNYMKVIQAIDRAMFFLQTRCGIRNINDINYSLVIVLLSVVFLE